MSEKNEKKHRFAIERQMEREVEAILFAANGPVDAVEIAETLDEPVNDVVGALERLQEKMDRRNGAIELASMPKGSAPGWHLRLREEFRGLADEIVPPELGEALLETLAVIAINQPVTQAEVVRVRGPRTYDDVKALAEQGYIARRRAKNRSYHLWTTDRFANEFQIENDPERIKETLGAWGSALIIAEDPDEDESPEEPEDPEAAEGAEGGAPEADETDEVPLQAA